MADRVISRRRSWSVLAVAAVVAALITPASTAQAAREAGTSRTPIIFVHGNSGSAQQFETDAMRFSSNGYPDDLLYVYEYDTSAPSNDAAINGLDGFIASVEAETGASQVDVLAHSRGTTVMHAYLTSSVSRAANVRHYVNFDGRTAASEPGGVPTLAIWGEGDPTRSIGGAENVYFPEMSHTEVTTSAAAFAYVYTFLTGQAPATTDVVPQPPGQVTVGGRVLYFPLNAGAQGAQVSMYQVNADNGRRLSRVPREQTTVRADGAFGPWKINGQQRYEFAVALPDGTTQHFYFQPFERSDHFLRLLVSPPGGIGSYIERGPAHTAIIVLRMREWRGDQPTASANDELGINGQNVLNAANAPRARRVLSIFMFDKHSDAVTDLTTPLTPFSLISFLTGIDVYIPASSDASGTVAVTETMREPGAGSETINVPNWPSSTDVVTVQFKDYIPESFSSTSHPG